MSNSNIIVSSMRLRRRRVVELGANHLLGTRGGRMEFGALHELPLRHHAAKRFESCGTAGLDRALHDMIWYAATRLGASGNGICNFL
jgi:hypothetical protein